jgi:hypothetical protein
MTPQPEDSNQIEGTAKIPLSEITKAIETHADDLIELFKRYGVPAGRNNYIVMTELVKKEGESFYKYSWFPKYGQD